MLGACDLRHGLPRTPAYGRAARADLSDHQALPGRDGARGDQPGAVSGHDGKSQDRSLMPEGSGAQRSAAPFCLSSGITNSQTAPVGGKLSFTSAFSWRATSFSTNMLPNPCLRSSTIPAPPDPTGDVSGQRGSGGENPG